MALSVQIEDMEPVVLAMDRLARLDMKSLRHRVAVQAQEAVETRILDEKRSPNGLRWAPWSAGYARTRKAEHSLLVDTGTLSESMQIAQTGLSTVMGTRVEYAKKNDIEREFMGLSRADEGNIENAIDEWMKETFS